MNFTDLFEKKATETTTENGGRAFTTTDSKVLDFFAAIGGMRNRDEDDIVELYLAAREEDKELADKIILWVGSVRDGQGERRIRRILMKELAEIDSHKVIRNFETFANLFRYDDLYAFENTPAERKMWGFLNQKLKADLVAMQEGESISLLAKWLKSINTSSLESKRLAKKFCLVNGWSEKDYRKALSSLRRYSNVVETKMSARKWNCINYETVPSKAMANYNLAFQQHSPERWNDYLERLKEGKTKINSSTLYPYDIVKKIGAADENILQAQWDSLPNYFDDGYNVIVMADVSGSMLNGQPRPIDVSTSLALYCAQRNQGLYHNYCITFTDEPYFFKFSPNESLEEAIGRLKEDVGYNTNLDGALEEIYRMAEETKECPDALLIISDNEIDYFVEIGFCDSICDKYVKKFKSIGIEPPKIIFWNVANRNGNYLDKVKNPYVNFISGASASTFSNLNTLITCTPYECMVKILDKYEYV